jgi:hypothetical protein
MQRRAHARYNVGFGAEVHTRDAVISAGTSDVSRGGCQLRSGRPMPEGATVRIELCLTIDGMQDDELPRLSVLGRVQWTAEGEDETGPVHVSGVRFEAMTAAQADWLENIIVQHGQPAPRPEHDPDVEIDIDVDA